MPNTVKLDRRFEAEMHVKAFEVGQRQQAAHEASRVKALIRQCAQAGKSLDETVTIVKAHGMRVQRTAGARWAVGAKPTKSAIVSTDDGVGKCVSQVVGAATCKAKEHKVRTRNRAEAAKHTFAHTVDNRRKFTHMSAPLRKGGPVYDRVRKADKRRLRAVVHKADQLALKGEFLAAIAVIRGEL